MWCTSNLPMADDRPPGPGVLRRRAAALLLLFLAVAAAGGLFLAWMVQLLSRSLAPQPLPPQPPARAADRDR